MSKTTNQKSELLYLIKILMGKTDTNHTLSVPRVIVELIKYIIMQNERAFMIKLNP